jgi:hypothetical protein
VSANVSVRPYDRILGFLDRIILDTPTDKTCLHRSASFTYEQQVTPAASAVGLSRVAGPERDGADCVMRSFITCAFCRV